MSDLNPSEVLSDQPQREDTLKSVYDKRPGHISWATDRANFSGCRLISFTANNQPISAHGLEQKDAERFDEQLDKYIEGLEDNRILMATDLVNLYFSTRANLLMLELRITDDTAACLVTTQLDDDDLEEFQEIQHRVNLEMREWREKRAERKAADAELLAENKRLVEVGKAAEQHRWKEKNRELTDELAEVKAELNKLKKEAKNAS